MAVAFIRQSTGTSNTVTLTAAASAGNYLVACIESEFGTTVSSIATSNVSWSKLASGINGFAVGVEIWLGAVSGGSSGTTATITKSGSGNTAVNISEYSGIASVSPVDVTGVSATGTDAAPTTGAYSTVTTGDIVIACVGYAAAVSVSTPPSGYTVLTQASASGPNRVNSAYKLGVATGAQSAAWAISSSAAWVTCIVALKAEASATIAHTASSALRATFTKPHTTSAALRATSTQTHTTGSALYSRRTATHTADSNLTGSRLVSHSTSVYLRESGLPHTTDSLLRATKTGAHTTNAALRATRTISQTTSAALAARRTGTHTTSSHLKGSVTRTHTTSTIKVRRNTASHTSSTYLINRPLPPPSAAGIRVGTWTSVRAAG